MFQYGMEWQQLKQAIKSVPGLNVQDVYIYGSAANGFLDENGDVDATVIAPGTGAVLVLQKLADVLPRLLPYFELRDTRFGARVPIIHLRGNGIDFDLSVNNTLPVFNTHLLKAYADLDHRIVTLVKEVKRWAKNAGVHGAPAGNLSSYALTLMSIYFAQIRGALPVLQGDHVTPQIEQRCNVAFGVPEGWRASAKSFNANNGDADLSFNDFVFFYSAEYGWGTECVSVRTGKQTVIGSYPDLKALRHVSAEERMQSIRIEDPIEISRDLADVLHPGRSVALREAFHAEYEKQKRKVADYRAVGAAESRLKEEKESLAIREGEFAAMMKRYEQEVVEQRQ